LFLLVTAGSPAHAAEIKLLSANALEAALVGLLTEFERSSGHKVTGEYRTAGAVADRIQKGEAVDVAIATVPQIENLQTQGRILAGSAVYIVKVGIGVFVRRGAAKPDISSAERFKRSLLAAKTIAYIDPASGGASGIYMASLLERLGIAGEMKPKTKLAAPGGPLDELVAKGDAEIGFSQISEIVAQPSAELVGPLPSAIQNYTLFAAGIVASSKQSGLGKALIEFLASPTTTAALKTKGFE
jgi:molybdate transport system substrate-binding protein